jgi:hypothetical protein
MGANMIELSAHDYEAILAAIEPYSGSQVNEMLDACYRAGIAAGIERSAKVIEAAPIPNGGFDLRKAWVVGIRALLK